MAFLFFVKFGAKSLFLRALQALASDQNNDNFVVSQKNAEMQLSVFIKKLNYGLVQTKR
jgi:hypothetical protein